MPWACTHAMVPTPVRLSEEIIRVYASFCDAKGIGRSGYVDVLADDPTKIVRMAQAPLFEIGEAGTFDENGVLVSSVVPVDQNKWLMYYAGFELGTKIRYRLLTGVAVSDDGGNSFKRLQGTPVLERSSAELYIRGGAFCMHDDGVFKLWYVGGSEWTVIGGKSMPVYDIRYLESGDGITWGKEGRVVLPVTEADEYGFGRPAVIRKPDGRYALFYSVRRRSFNAYRLGYAESDDGLTWKRMDSDLNLDVSADGFDSQAIMYAAPIQVGDKLYVFYNGNEFGKDGFAVAALEK